MRESLVVNTFIGGESLRTCRRGQGGEAVVLQLTRRPLAGRPPRSPCRRRFGAPRCTPQTPACKTSALVLADNGEQLICR